jgi:hypothetical protein
MAFLQRIGQFFTRLIPNFGSFAGLHSLDSNELFEKGEELAAGLGLAALACWCSELVPWWVGLIALGAGAGAVFSIDKHFFPLATRTALFVTAAFVAFSQPLLAFLAIAAITGWVCFLCLDRLYGFWATTAAGLGTFIGSVAVYLLASVPILSFLHPLTVVLLNDAGPLIAAGVGVLVTIYCAWRIKGDVDDRLFYKLAPGVCAALFAVFFPMKNSWTGIGAEWLFVVAAFALAFRGPRALFIGGTTVGALFAAAFVLMNTSSFMHEVAMAESMSVHEVQRLPASSTNRIMPVVVGRDFCIQGDDANMLETAEPHALIMNGTFYWQCAAHYTGFQINHLMSWIPGSTAGFVMVNAGTTASDTRLNLHGFIFGEKSSLVKAAFETRHPNGTIAGFAYAANSKGDYYLLVSYTTHQLFWGGMVPTLGGVMVVSPWGFVEDYTVAQAARAFPGTFLYPSDLARQYADVWGKRKIGKMLSRSLLEVSEAPQAAQGNLSNPFPYGIDTEAGRKYFIPYEPQGKNGTAMSDVAFFDGATGDSDVEILHLADSDQTGETNALGHRTIQGPKELLEKSANVVQGHFQLTAIEPIIVVTKAGRIYFITANMGPDKTKSNHDYQGDTLSFATGEPQWVITSSADADRHIEEHEKLLDAVAKPAATQALPAAPAPNLPQ